MTNDGDKPTKLELLQQLVIAYNSNFVNPSWSLGTSNERMEGAVERFFFDGGHNLVGLGGSRALDRSLDEVYPRVSFTSHVIRILVVAGDVFLDKALVIIARSPSFLFSCRSRKDHPSADRYCRTGANF